MLYRNVVTPSTFNIFQNILEKECFQNFFLAGGTSLALQIGHRLSIDLDFFSTQGYDVEKVKETLIQEFDAKILGLSNNSLTGLIKGVKVEFISHQYPLLQKLVLIDNCRLASIPDIAAMKINAVRNRGSKKDFVDLYFLLKRYQIQELLEFTNKKYPNHENLMTLKSLLYFDQADSEPDPTFTNEPLNWQEIKSFFQHKITPLV
ncbi:MAG: nucleotidyl transferase AbiEii/AbiGii toxin family protein [Crocinitomicaceae bacterium]